MTLGDGGDNTHHARRKHMTLVRLRTLKDMNKRFPEDMLSRKMYRYDGSKNEIVQLEL